MRYGSSPKQSPPGISGRAMKVKSSSWGTLCWPDPVRGVHYADHTCASGASCETDDFYVVVVTRTALTPGGRCRLTAALVARTRAEDFSRRVQREKRDQAGRKRSENEDGHHDRERGHSTTSVLAVTAGACSTSNARRINRSAVSKLPRPTCSHARSRSRYGSIREPPPRSAPRESESTPAPPPQPQE